MRQDSINFLKINSFVLIFDDVGICSDISVNPDMDDPGSAVDFFW